MPPGAKTTKTTASRRPGDDQRARDLLSWCRKSGIHVSRVRVGDVELDGLVDITRIPIPEVGTQGQQTDLREQFGGAALARLELDRQRSSGGVFAEDDDD